RRVGVRGDAERLDLGIEGLVVVPELLEVRHISRACPIGQRYDKTRLVFVAADARGRLDVFGGVLRLADHEHQAESWHVDADLEHRGSEDDVVGLLTPWRRRLARFFGLDECLAMVGATLGAPSPGERPRQLVECLGNVFGGDARGELADLKALTVGGAPGERFGLASDAYGDVVIEITPHASEFAGGREVAD